MPSGDHSPDAPVVRARTSVPSAAIEYRVPLMWSGAGRLLTNRMRVPSGDHEAPRSRAAELVRFCGPEPSAFMIQMSDWPPESTRNRIFEPSGEKAIACSEAGLDVSCWAPVPSLFTTQTSAGTPRAPREL